MMAGPDRRGVVGRPELVSFPSDDAAFAREVRARLARDDPGSPEELQRSLRPRFPRIVVRRRGLSGEPRATWYVFRDGKVLNA